MNASSVLDSVSNTLRDRGLSEVEVYLKEGASRRFEFGSQGLIAERHEEVGWAVRASSERASMFCAGTGSPEGTPFPEADGYPLRLPKPYPLGDWREPAGLDIPLAVESEAFELLEACADELRRDEPSFRLLGAVLEDGESRSSIASTRGVAAEYRSRTAGLHLEAACGRGENHRVREFLIARNARQFNPRSLTRRLADRLVLLRDGRPASRDRAPVLLAPVVSARLLGALTPLLVGSEARKRAEPWLDLHSGRIASRQLTVVDDGRFATGLLAAPVDGEGVPTGALHLIEEGSYRGPLEDWRSDDAQAIPGNQRRPGWREPPETGPSHLFVLPDGGNPVRSLLVALTRGYYLIDVTGSMAFDFAANSFAVEVSGFAVRDGEAREAIARTILSGKISSLLSGVQAVGRDLTFFAAGAILGSPSVLVSGLEVGPSES